MAGAEAALPFATSLIWLDLPWSACSEGLARRRPLEGRLRRASTSAFLRNGPTALLAAHDVGVVRWTPEALDQSRRGLVCRGVSALALSAIVALTVHR